MMGGRQRRKGAPAVVGMPDTPPPLAAITGTSSNALSLAGSEAVQAPDTRLADDPEVVALVDRAVAGRDRVAFGDLYDRFVDRVYRYLYYRTGRQTDAEDLTEQVFLKAWEAIDRFQWQGRPFLAWLYRLAHNVHVDHLRRRRATASLDDGDSPIDPPSEAAARELARPLDADLLARAVARLTPEQQQVIVLKFLDGLENDQIARILSKREGSIRALQMRALQRLRRVLERQGEVGPA